MFVPLSTVAFLTLPNHLRTDGTSMLTLMRNVASSIGISIVIAQLTEGRPARLCDPVRAHHPVQPCDADAERRGMIDIDTDGGRALADAMVASPGADHRVLAGLSAGDVLHPGLDPADLDDRLDQGRVARQQAPSTEHAVID